MTDARPSPLRLDRAAAALSVVLLLAACGKDDKAAAAPGSAPAAAAASQQAAADDDLRCPAKIKTAVEGPDIAGLRLGLGRDEALNLARCAQRDGVVVNENRFLSGLNTGAMKLGPQQFTVQSGDTAECKFTSFSDAQDCGIGQRVWKHIAETVVVATPGVPGRETAVGIWRTQNYKAGEQPAATTVQQALIDKYGPPQRIQKYEGNRPSVQMWWMRDPGGQVLSEQNPLANRCPSIQAHGNAPQSWSDACGLTIAAMLTLSPVNPLLVADLSVGMADQAKLYAYGEAMQEEIIALEKQRQEGEAKAASEGAAAPKL